MPLEQRRSSVEMAKDALKDGRRRSSLTGGKSKTQERRSSFTKAKKQEKKEAVASGVVTQFQIQLIADAQQDRVSTPLKMPRTPSDQAQPPLLLCSLYVARSVSLRIKFGRGRWTGRRWPI